ncbi:DNA-binding transcriptional LysR family regulator [Xanthomonas sp. 3272]|uniref:LysR family transcriptional regulator n=1 Tax=Xanthomonas arboricola TaxID=56448 RepID=UPI00142FA621|nr:LysR family transcriptional regulator [Xanthomonas arboricola]NJC03105.1 DNA-binding transcriptional LysR family regulator [Xanthomonas arboricola]
MELTWLEDCLALAETLNFSRAAQRRFVTQPAFSRRIHALEEWLGTPLFTRSRKEVLMTPAGEAFVRKASGLVSGIYAARQETLEVAGRHRPALAFLATHVLSFTFFPAFVRRIESNTGIGAFQLVSDTLRACEKLMLQGAAQFLLCHHHPRMRLGLDTEQFERVVVGNDVLQPFSAAKENGNGSPRWSLASTDAMPLLSYSADSGLGRIIAGHPAFQDVEPRLTPALTSDLAATLLAMCRSGAGIAWLPRTLVEEDLARGLLVHAAPGDTHWDIGMEICLLRHTGGLPQQAEDMWEKLKQGKLET